MNLTNVLQIGTEATDVLLRATPSIKAIGVCIAIGYLCKAIPGWPNKGIPVPVILTGPIAYVFLGCPDLESWVNYSYPMVAQVLWGLLLGVVSWGIHNKFLKGWIDEKFWPSTDQAAKPPTP